MALEPLAVLMPRDFTRLSGGSVNSNDIALSGSVGGLRLMKSDLAGYSAIIALGSTAIATGFTLGIGIVDDGKDASDLGKVVRLGVTVKKIVSGTDDLDIASGASAESTVDVTLDATTGQVVLGALAILNAALDSIVVNSTGVLRIRRIGTHANDTCLNSVLMTHVQVSST